VRQNVTLLVPKTSVAKTTERTFVIRIQDGITQWVDVKTGATLDDLRSLKSVGPNATLVEDDIEAVIRGLKAQLVGEIEVAGPDLARTLTDLGLIDEYQLYFRPFVLGRGKPFFAGPRPPLRLVASDPIGEDAIRLTYVPGRHG
jgi:riboflavin biosynthesis pyrimidine reductase